jgi:hypothetical protein
MTVTIGADPEVFLLKEGSMVTPTGLIEGTKLEPFPVEKGAIQQDGTAAEFNIDPTSTPEEFVDNLSVVMRQLEELSGCELDPEVVRHWGFAALNDMSDTEKVMGCEPDFNAWSGKVNPKPSAETPFRTAGGHVHVGFISGGANDPGYRSYIEPLVRILDEQIGVPSLLWDGNSERRELYGKAGAYRPKVFGLEYRVLSNAWIKNPAVCEFIFNQATKAVEMWKRGHEASKDALDIINGNKYEMAEKFCLEHEVPINDFR